MSWCTRAGAWNARYAELAASIANSARARGPLYRADWAATSSRTAFSYRPRDAGSRGHARDERETSARSYAASAAVTRPAATAPVRPFRILCCGVGAGRAEPEPPKTSIAATSAAAVRTNLTFEGYSGVHARPG